MKNYIIVTGGAGFVGSHLIEYLIRKTKFKIMNYDDFLVQEEHNYRGWNDKEKTCPECDTPIDDDQQHCSSICFNASML